MQDHVTTPDEFAALINEGEDTQPKAKQAKIQLSPVPARIHIRDKSTPFAALEYASWGYTQFGVYATGTWGTDDGKTDILVPYEAVDYIEFDYDLYQEIRERHQAEAEELANTIAASVAQAGETQDEGASD